MVQQHGAHRRRGRKVTSAMVAIALAVGTFGTAQIASADPASPMSVGANADGQLATGNKLARLTAGATKLQNITQIVAGRAHAYALDGDGNLWAWGDNSKGAVGDGTLVDRSTPVIVLTQVRQVAAGDDHGIAVTFSDEVYVWGAGGFGQLGLGTTTNRRVPTLLEVSGDQAEIVAAGGGSSYIFRTGLIYSFGLNSSGQLGDGTTTNRTRPVLVPGIQSFEGVVAGRNHAYAIDDDSVWGWGANQFGQLGDGTTTMRTLPVEVLNTGAVTVVAGSDHSAALMYDGSVLTWGRGHRGQLGLGTTSNRFTPRPVPGLSNVTNVAAGFDQTFAMSASGQAWAWGANDAGQLGDGTTAQRIRPVGVVGVGGVTDVATGRNMTFFLPGLQLPPPGEVMFADDFATGLGQWAVTGAGFAIDNAIGSPSDAPPSARVQVADAAGSAVGGLINTFAIDEGCASAGVRVHSIGPARYALMKLRNIDQTSIARVQIDSARRLSVRADIAGTTFTTNAVLAADTWARITLCVTTGPTGNGLLQLRLNGQTINTWATTTGNIPFGLIQIGDNESRTATVNWDDVVVLSGTM